VLIADDHAPTRDDVRRAVESEQGFEVCASAADAAEAVQGLPFVNGPTSACSMSGCRAAAWPRHGR
jgi:DNA-binding NarL/FixJ family response regulator